LPRTSLVGAKLEWPKMTEGKGTFDLLVPSLGNDGLQIECKALSVNKGRRVHRREALDFLRLLWKEMASMRKSLKTELSVVLTMRADMAVCVNV
jgi:hypothetical protein